MNVTDEKEMLSRWRLVLGQFADDNLPLEGSDGDADDALSFLYDREYGSGRDIRQGQSGGRGASILTVPQWISKVKTLFPKQTADILQKDALNKYGIDEMLTDPDVLKNLSPDIDLLGKLLSFRNIIPSKTRHMADEIIRKCVEEIQKKLETNVRRCFYGKKLSSTQSYYKIFRNFNFRKTIEQNLKNYSPEFNTIIPRRLYFSNTVKRYNPWDIIILVDQSGSMCNSVIYSAVIAGIFAKLPFLRTNLAVFDTSVVDLSEYVSDAAELLMKVQLGGGTDIFKALCYGESLIHHPAKTIVILITDLYEGGDIRHLYRKCSDILEGGSKLFVLPALDYDGEPSYNRPAAKYIAAMGADVAAVTPEKLADWIGQIIS